MGRKRVRRALFRRLSTQNTPDVDLINYFRLGPPIDCAYLVVVRARNRRLSTHTHTRTLMFSTVINARTLAIPQHFVQMRHKIRADEFARKYRPGDIPGLKTVYTENSN